MKHLLTDIKLVNLVNEIEKLLGPIGLDEMEDIHKETALCSVTSNLDGGWILLIDSNRELPQSLICHELAHLILVIEGWPGFTVSDSIPKRTNEYEVLSMLSNLILHIDVWDIVKKMGFDENVNYLSGQQGLLSKIKDATLFSHARSTLVDSFRAAYIAQSLLGTGTNEYKEQIAFFADRTMPNALKLAKEVVKTVKDSQPLTAESCPDVLLKIFNIINIEPSFLTLHKLDVIEDGFRQKFISN